MATSLDPVTCDHPRPVAEWPLGHRLTLFSTARGLFPRFRSYRDQRPWCSRIPVMGVYTQVSRLMAVTTPLGSDVLLLTGFSGHEALSQPFRFELELLAENRREIAFEKLLGQKITVQLSLPRDKKRTFNGICNRFTQGERDELFTAYQMEIVPQFWLLTKRVQCRIFQHLTVPDILKKVLDGLDVAYEIQGTFHPRNFCVQYRESDFNFASRLMEEEGIYYFFKHTADGHKMVV